VNISGYLISLRPSQWTKNLFLFAALFFSKNLFNFHPVLRITAAFFLYCLLSGASYIFNDLCDRESDRNHPLKSKRPIASGAIGTSSAVFFMVICALASLGGAFAIGREFFVLCVSVLLLQISYSLVLKKIVIVDVFVIAVLFVLRVAAGAFVIDVEISSWILICTLLLALFLALGKRRHEFMMSAGGNHNHRAVLKEYSVELLDQMISIVASATVITYALYTVSESTKLKFHTQNLLFTVPFVLYGIFRYLYIIHRKQEGANPENILISDKPLYVNILLWLLTAGIILYVR
jgi:4-hydroxybenzoate polyprenyltransferase